MEMAAAMATIPEMATATIPEMETATGIVTVMEAQTAEATRPAQIILKTELAAVEVCLRMVARKVMAATLRGRRVLARNVVEAEIEVKTALVAGTSSKNKIPARLPEKIESVEKSSLIKL